VYFCVWKRFRTSRSTPAPAGRRSGFLTAPAAGFEVEDDGIGFDPRAPTGTARSGLTTSPTPRTPSGVWRSPRRRAGPGSGARPRPSGRTGGSAGVTAPASHCHGRSGVGRGPVAVAPAAATRRWSSQPGVDPRPHTGHPHLDRDPVSFALVRLSPRSAGRNPVGWLPRSWPSSWGVWVLSSTRSWPRHPSGSLPGARGRSGGTTVETLVYPCGARHSRCSCSPMVASFAAVEAVAAAS